MAALVAGLNQAKRRRIGFINPFLYANADKGMFVDVDIGCNGIVDTVEGYDARAGWDACTGLGTPVGEALLAQL
jgi:kumamolisin